MAECVNCGKPHERRSPYCRESCASGHRAKLKRQEARATRPTVECKHCGKAFSPLRPDHIFCSPQCRKPTVRPPEPPETSPPAGDQIVASLVAKGFLPPATCTAPDGQLAWTADAMARLFDLELMPFLGMMCQRGPVYTEHRGVPSSWGKLMES